MNPIPFWEPVLQGSEEKFLLEVLRSRYWNDGELTRRFEEEIAKRLNVSFAVATTSGTAALFLALKALEIGPGDEVLVPDVTFIATANAVTMAGAKTVLVDVEPKTLGLDPKAVEKHITPRTKAILVVHVSGRAAELNGLQELARDKNLFLVEDAAQAFGSRNGSQFLGTFGQAGCFSFSPNKIMTTGQGGVVVTKDARLFECLKMLKDQGRKTQGTGGADLHESIGFNFKFTNLQAAVGLAQIQDLEKRTSSMRQIYKWYKENLQNLASVAMFPFKIEKGESPQWVDAVVERRDELIGYLKQFGFTCRPYWHALHTQRPYQGKDQDFPVAASITPKALWFPSLFTLSKEQVGGICSRIRQFYGV